MKVAEILTQYLEIYITSGRKRRKLRAMNIYIPHMMGIFLCNLSENCAAIAESQISSKIIKKTPTYETALLSLMY
jgi:hypothetical protein